VIKRVAVVTESFLPQINGVTNSVLRVLETFKQQSMEAIVIAPTSGTDKYLGYRVHTTPALPIFQFPVALPSPSVSRILDDFRPDVIHVAAPFLLGQQAIAWGQRNAVPTVAIYQTDVTGYLERYGLNGAKPIMERITAAIHSNATLTLAPTPQTATYLRQIGVERVELWGRGVDLDLFNPIQKLEPETHDFRKSVAGDARLVGFVGRLAAEKQVHRMRELFGLHNTRFLVVGDGPERAKLEQDFSSYPVTFTGALQGQELARAYAAMDVFVHFGTEETFGQTIQEAQATGLAVVAPNSGGPVHLIEHDETGKLVDPTLPHGYLQAVSDLFEAPSLLEKLQLKARAAVSNRSWRENNKKLLSYYVAAQTSSRARLAGQLELAR
jgi:phosphatidylinositol alpha 1,6-mannosyltransferase